MEKKTKHRILGMLVVTGLVIISLPLLQSTNEPPTQLAVINPPPFPDPSIAGNQSEINVSSQPDDTIPARPVVASNPPLSETTASNIIPVASQPPHVDEPVQMKKNDSSEHDVNAVKLASAPQPVSQIADTDSKIDSPVKAVSSEPEIKKSQVVAVKDKVTPVKKITKPLNVTPKVVELSTIENNKLSDVKQAVWVIQMGSFKNKIHALRLVNTLRARGYRTFIQQVDTSLGESTRVFVGPETKQIAARELASKLETELHLRGFVIRYKPFAL